MFDLNDDIKQTIKQQLALQELNKHGGFDKIPSNIKEFIAVKIIDFTQSKTEKNLKEFRAKSAEPLASTQLHK